MSSTEQKIWDLVRLDPRYAIEAYQFVLEALNHTQNLLGRSHENTSTEPSVESHVNGPELLEGACVYAIKEFGLMAKTVFHMWGIRRTDDIGEIVFNMIECGMLSKTERDSRADFHNVFNLDQILTEGFSIETDESVWHKRGSR
jgi:uncharacterized repeat protein (TIGR04138 family)